MVGGGAFVAAAQLVDRVARHRSGVLMIGPMAELLVQERVIATYSIARDAPSPKIAYELSALTPWAGCAVAA
jgi:hypothetical protein